MAILQLPTKAQPREVVRDGDLIPDNRLAPGAQDLLEHDSIARAVAEIAWTAEAPVNIALFGAWGSGKSSVYSMVEQHLARIAPRKVKVARYDAWKYGGRELKRNFIDSLAQELKLGHKTEFSDGLENDQETPKLRTFAWFKENAGSLAFGALLAVGVAVLWVLAQTLAAVAFTDDHFKATARALITQAGTVFGLALVATLVGPKVFEGAVRTKKTPAPEGADQFANRFKKLVDAALDGKTNRLVVFIDELDRCDAKDVVATLRDLKTFLDQENCVFVVAADREVIERALDDLPQAKPVREDEPYYATPGAFLDKIFQHQIALPPLRSRALTKFAHDLVDKQAGVWKELRDHDEDGRDTFDRTVFALVPVHVRSPRRVKVLLNNFATNARIAESRGIEWLDRAHELAVLTVLQTEFPAVAEDLRRVPRLLIYLRGKENPLGSIGDVVAKYIESSSRTELASDEVQKAGGGAADIAVETAAGRLLSDDPSPTGARERALASANLRRHLTNYLDKVAAAGIRDPRLDLLYLQTAAGREHLPEPALGDAIDYAADTAPDTVVAAFDGHQSATLAIAIPLLVTQGDSESMPGRGFAYESACRLIERLDPDDYNPVTALVAPSLMAAAAKNILSQHSMPGALLVSCWDGADATAIRILDQVDRSEPSEDLLDRLTVALPHLDVTGRDALLSMLAGRFKDFPQPLLTALREASTPDAIGLWDQVEDRVLDVLNALEVAASDNEPEPERTGEGIALLERTVDAIRSRNDCDEVLSRVLQSVQSPRAVAPLREWMDENADRLVGTMAAPIRRARHALIALREYPDTDVVTWSALMPDHDDLNENSDKSKDPVEKRVPGEADKPTPDVVDMTDLVGAVTAEADGLVAHLLTAYATVGEGGLQELNMLTRKVAEWSSVTAQDLATWVTQTLARIGWEGGEVDDTTGQLLWQRKTSLFATVTALANPTPAMLYAPFVDDLSEMLRSIKLSHYAIEHWREMIRELPVEAAATLSDHVDAYDPSETELGAVMQMRLTVRVAADGQAPPAAELLEVPADQHSTALTDAWLALRPDAAEAVVVLTNLVYSVVALRKYCDSLSVNDRTSVWIALYKIGVKDDILKAAGAAGIGAEALVCVRVEIAKETREPERTGHVSRLRCAEPAGDVDAAAVKKAASEIAFDLLDRGTAGDLRAAADVVLWAGGAGYGYKESLRDRFTDLVERHEKALSKKGIARLDDVGLLTVRKKGFLATLLGR